MSMSNVASLRINVISLLDSLSLKPGISVSFIP